MQSRSKSYRAAYLSARQLGASRGSQEAQLVLLVRQVQLARQAPLVPPAQLVQLGLVDQLVQRALLGHLGQDPLVQRALQVLLLLWQAQRAQLVEQAPLVLLVPLDLLALQVLLGLQVRRVIQAHRDLLDRPARQVQQGSPVRLVLAALPAQQELVPLDLLVLRAPQAR